MVYTTITRKGYIMGDVTTALEVLYGQRDIASCIRLIDDYMQRIQKLGVQFKLPKSDAWLLPILERYAYDLPGFVKFVKAVCLDLTGTDQKSDVVAFYRTLVVRVVQQQRRERTTQALAWFDKNYPTVSAQDRKVWIFRLEQQWKQQRLATLRAVRSKTKNGRIPIEEREEVLAQFWASIGEDITNGRLPPPR